MARQIKMLMWIEILENNMKKLIENRLTNKYVSRKTTPLTLIQFISSSNYNLFNNDLLL